MAMPKWNSFEVGAFSEKLSSSRDTEIVTIVAIVDGDKCVYLK